MSNFENIKNKFQIQKYNYKNLKTQVDQFYQDIFNISVNSDINSINNFNSEYTIYLKDFCSEIIFVTMLDYINKILIICFFFSFYFIIKNNIISIL